MDNKKDKCNKYESLFIFQNDEQLQKHIDTCESCKSEHEKYKKVSMLVKSVAPLYLEREQKSRVMKSVQKLACCFVAFIAVSVFTGVNIYENYAYQAVLEQGSTVSDMGLPVDDYGFLFI